MPKVMIYSSRYCGYCRMAERLLEKKGVLAEKVMVDEHPDRREEMIRRAGQTSVPQIFIDDKHVGGYAELAGLERQGRLDELLAASPT